MKYMIASFALMVGLVGLASRSDATEPAAEKSKPVAIFDGKTLNGWEGDLKVFRVEDGAIVGGSLKAALSHNEFLTSNKEYADFELRLKVKLTGAASANGGIQFRSRRVPNNREMSGYQADMGQHYWGSLYDESRRNKTLAGPDPVELKKVLKPDDWNDYVIRCEGRHIQLWLNGLKTVDYTEPDEKLEQKGLIGLQIHGGPASEAWYKDIEIREF
jgi:3-keto-disaccharide hydrolase